MVPSTSKRPIMESRELSLNKGVVCMAGLGAVDTWYVWGGFRGESVKRFIKVRSPPSSPEFSHGLRVGLPGGDEYLEGFFLGVFKTSRFCDSNSVENVVFELELPIAKSINLSLFSALPVGRFESDISNSVEILDGERVLREIVTSF